MEGGGHSPKNLKAKTYYVPDSVFSRHILIISTCHIVSEPNGTEGDEAVV